MARWSQRSYWLVVHACLDRFHVPLEDAREFYRRFRDWLGRPAFGTDFFAHLRKVRQIIDDSRRQYVPPPPPTGEPIEYEVTIRYTDEKGIKHHITTRLIGPAGSTTAEARRVFWRAANGKPLDYWQVFPIDWERESRRGPVMYGPYTWQELTEDVAEARKLRTLFNAATIRVERVDQT